MQYLLIRLQKSQAKFNEGFWAAQLFDRRHDVDLTCADNVIFAICLRAKFNSVWFMIATVETSTTFGDFCRVDEV